MTSRFSLSARVAQTDANGSWKANVYIIHSELDLYNNFTWFLTDPVNGDQFHQHDDRIYGHALFDELEGRFGAFRGVSLGAAAQPRELAGGCSVKVRNRCGYGEGSLSPRLCLPRSLESEL